MKVHFVKSMWVNQENKKQDLKSFSSKLYLCENVNSILLKMSVWVYDMKAVLYFLGSQTSNKKSYIITGIFNLSNN